MGVIKKSNDIAIIICGHGSRNKGFQSDFLNFVRLLELHFKEYKVYYCFIEINKPLIYESLNNILKTHNKIIFFPALILKGKHFKIDVVKKINEISKITITKSFVLKNLELSNNITSVFSNIIKSKLVKRNLLVTICSYSKQKRIKEDIDNYTSQIASKLRINNYIYCSYGDEEKIYKKIDILMKEENIQRIILHPIFLFNGFLYQTTKKRFQSVYKDKVLIIKPMLSYNKIISIIKESIESKIELLK